jgi:hypothetical protein
LIALYEFCHLLLMDAENCPVSVVSFCDVVA